VSARSLRGPLVAVLAAALCWACPILGHDEEPLAPGPVESEDRIPVVDEAGPFDPSEAVDDDDGDVVLADTDDPTDASAFADEEGGGEVRAIEASAEKAERTEEAENERRPGGGRDEPGAPGEPVADEAEAAAREQDRKEAVERVDASGAEDDEKKVELGHNPPPEPTVESERETGKVLDVALETLLVAIVAALLSGALVFARSHPRSVLVGLVGACLVAAFFWSQVE
jgi:hypothetical protein